jgi:hypothetical protein
MGYSFLIIIFFSFFPSHASLLLVRDQHVHTG